MKKYLAAFALTGALVAPAFSADSYTIDPEYTIPTFEVEHLGFTTQHGRFNKSSGKVTLDVAARKGSVEFTIMTDSIDLGSTAWNLHISSDGLFNVEKFLTMYFKSDKLIFEGDKVVAADGNLTLIGVTKPLRIAVNRFACGVNPVNHKALCAGNITANIKRSDFGMVKYIPAVSDDIKIAVPVEAYKD